jgi:demethylmenaquinone methyltransferase/2-methoxy-6-polyprenyl-1,4-benzoquinol methylase
MTVPAGRDSLMSAEDNRRMFDRIARRYDLMNRLLSLGLDRRWRRKAVSALRPGAGRRYLDIGCGTGDMAIEIVRQCPGALVVGIDPAGRMLEIAAQRVRKAGLKGSIRLQTGDAAELAFEDGSFAGTVTAFCIRNVMRQARAIREMRRVLAPGGRAVILELTVPHNRVLRLGHRLHTACLVPLAGRLVARNAEAYRYLVDSVRHFRRPQELLAMMAEAGFSDPCHIALLGGTVTIFVGRAE